MERFVLSQNSPIRRHGLVRFSLDEWPPSSVSSASVTGASGQRNEKKWGFMEEVAFHIPGPEGIKVNGMAYGDPLHPTLLSASYLAD